MSAIKRIVCAIPLLFLLCAQAGAADPQIVRISGRAEIRDAASRQWEAAAKNSPFPPGAAVRVSGSGSATVADDNIEVTIGRDSTLSYHGAGSVPQNADRPPARGIIPVYSLPRGSADVTVTPGKNCDLFTPLIVTSVRGTRFAVSVSSDGSSRVAVKNGSVLIKDKLGRQRSLNAGQSHSLGAMEYVRSLRAVPRPAKEPPPEPALGGGGGDGGGGSGGGRGGGSGGGSGGRSGGGDD